MSKKSILKQIYRYSIPYPPTTYPTAQLRQSFNCQYRLIPYLLLHASKSNVQSTSANNYFLSGNVISVVPQKCYSEKKKEKMILLNLCYLSIFQLLLI